MARDVKNWWWLVALAEYFLSWRYYKRRNVAVTTSPFAIILTALESPCKALEHSVGRLFIKTLVGC
jgi:hypothetical protein